MICRPFSFDDGKAKDSLVGHLEYFGRCKCTVMVLLSVKPHILAKLTSVSRQGFKKVEHHDWPVKVDQDPLRDGITYYQKAGEEYVPKVDKGAPCVSDDSFGILYVAITDPKNPVEEVIQKLNGTAYVLFRAPLMTSPY